MTTVPRSSLDTGHVRPRERFALWREALAPTHEVHLPEGCELRRFSASACTHHLGSALVLESRATPQRLLRSPRATRLDQIDHYILRLQVSGSWTGDIGGRSVTAGPGSVMVLDMARVCDAHTTDIENINLMLPRDALDDELAPFDMHGLVLRNGMAALLRSHLSALAANLPLLEAADAGRVAAATLSLAAACLAPSREAVERARAPLETALIAEIRRYIDRHLHAPDLSPHKVGAALGLSRSALYAACEPMGGVAAFIQQRRLKRAHAILTDPRDRRRIAEVAEQYGFVSGAHFSRAFRNAFGYSPSEAREARQAREAAAARAPAGGAGPVDSTYAEWVSRLGA